MNKSTAQNIFLLIIFIGITVLTSVQMYQMVNLLFLILCSILLIINRPLLILIYIIVLPTNGFISTEYNLLGILHVSYIVNLLATLAVIREWNSIPAGIKNQTKKPQKHKKYARVLILFLLLYLVLTDLRLFYFGMRDFEEIHKLITRPIKYFVMFYPLLLLIKLSEIKKYEEIIKRGFIIGAGLVAFTIIFSGYFTQLGFATQDVENFLENTYQDGFIRRAGIFQSMGDVNSASGYMALFFGYLLFFGNNYKSKFKTIALILSVLAIIATGSRTGFVNLALVTIIFLFTREFSGIRKIQYAFFLIIIVFVFLAVDLFDPILERFNSLRTGEDQALDPEGFGRLGGWIVYLNYIFSDINITLWGTTESMYESFYSYSYERVAHNYYIQVWYYWGVIPLIVLFAAFFRFIRFAFKSYKKYAFLALFTPLFLTLFTVSDTGIFLAFILSLMAVESTTKQIDYVNK